jgi:hypothetical protein
MPRILPSARLVLLVACAACQPSHEGSTPARTERERDSVIGSFRLPGATGVRGALRAQDSAAAQNARLDSLASQP